MSVAALRELGYTVVEAADAARGARACWSCIRRSSCCSPTWSCPDMNGRRLADEVSQRRPGLKVLFTTGYTRNAIVHNGMLDAGVSLITKPFTLDQLARKVAEALRD